MEGVCFPVTSGGRSQPHGDRKVRALAITTAPVESVQPIDRDNIWITRPLYHVGSALLMTVLLKHRSLAQGSLSRVVACTLGSCGRKFAGHRIDEAILLRKHTIQHTYIWNQRMGRIKILHSSSSGPVPYSAPQRLAILDHRSRPPKSPEIAEIFV